MKTLIFNILALLFSTISYTQTNYKFDFGTGKVAEGYHQVLPETIYSAALGYGFMPESKVQGENRGGKNALTSDFCTSDKPFFFTLDIPEGNYDVKVILGDAKDESETTVKVENRRLMLENIHTKIGEFVTKTFTVNIRNRFINNTTEQVKLKPRELDYLHWDKQLTFEFAGTKPKICAIEISKNEHAATIFLAGNSTVVDQAQEPFSAWGQMIPRFFKAENVVFANHAESGETIKSFVTEKRLDKVMSQMKAGDYFFIEFAHNDQKTGNGIEANTTYKEYLQLFINKTREKGAIPVLVTSMHRRNFDSTNHIINTLGQFPEAMRAVAKQENVALIDLNEMSKTLWEALGVENSKKAFVHYKANTFEGQSKDLADNTHFNNYGAYQLAKCIIEGIKAAKLPISKDLLPNSPTYNPAQPDDLNQWNFPNSPLVKVIKPDGN